MYKSRTCVRKLRKVIFAGYLFICSSITTQNSQGPSVNYTHAQNRIGDRLRALDDRGRGFRAIGVCLVKSRLGISRYCIDHWIYCVENTIAEALDWRARNDVR